MKNIFWCFPLILVLTSCASPKNISTSTISGNSGAQLTEAEIVKNENLAQNGDDAALQKLITHYQYGAPKLNKLIHWYEVSSNKGNLTSKNNLGAIYANGNYGYSVTKESCDRGISLIKECVSAGASYAGFTLQEAVKNCVRYK